jgi:hypothetical protein
MTRLLSKSLKTITDNAFNEQKIHNSTIFIPKQ